MKTIIYLDKKDIITAPCGLNFMIGDNEGNIQINLTKEACEELYIDLKKFVIDDNLTSYTPTTTTRLLV